MKKSPVKFDKFAGLNNVDRARETELAELQTAINVDINDQGRLKRRQGYDRVYPGNISSLFSDGGTTLFREGPSLKRLNADYTATTLRTDMYSTQPVSYVSLNGLIYYTDGVVTGVVDNGANRTWGLARHPQPNCSDIPGDLPPGRYQVSIVYRRRDGQEGGCGTSTILDCTGGIRINNLTASTDSTVDAINIYVSGAGGETLYRAMTVSNTDGTADYQGYSKLGKKINTQLMHSPLPGHMIAYHKGRIYIADGNVVWYTEPYRLELLQRRKNFLPFGSRVTMLSPVDGGIWVGTLDGVFFLQGANPVEGFKIHDKATYGPIEGTAAPVDGEFFATEQFTPNHGWVWASTKGICMGTDDGFFMNITGGRYEFPDAANGIGMVKLNPENNQYLVGLYYSRLLQLPSFVVSSTGV